MRLLPLFFFALIAVRLTAGPLTAVRVWTDYRTAESFERISEYFTGQEASSKELILRSRAEERAGYYFLVRVANPQVEGCAATAEIKVILPGQTTAQTFLLRPAVALPRGQTVLHLGLTGPDWPDAKQAPVAWQVRLLADDGSELLRERSFLWGQAD